MDRYPEMVYGWCLQRIIHFILSLRVAFPNQHIYVAKFDYSDAYRRISHAARAAVQTILVVGQIAYIMFRLAFGGSPNPPCFCAFSETLTDLANELTSSDYNPDRFWSPTVEPEHLDPCPYISSSEPFAEGIAPAVEVPLSVTARKDCFIDDIISIFLGTVENLKQEGNITPLAVYAMSRPHAGDDKESIKTRALLEPTKLIAEGRPSEVMLVLGWLVNTRRLLVGLPDDKFKAWVTDLDKVLESGKIDFKDLESLVGRLNHASFLIPLSRHFLNDLRLRINQREKLRHQVLRLSKTEILDLHLWKAFLVQANTGISMNLLTLRVPTGLKGLIRAHMDWVVIPSQAELGESKSKSPRLLLSTVKTRPTTYWSFLGWQLVSSFSLKKPRVKTSHVSFPLATTATSAIAWIFRSGKISKESPYYKANKMIVRKIATTVIKAEAQLTAQHLPGKNNDISDLLSFAGKVRGYTNPLTSDDPPNDVLTKRNKSNLPQIVPENFEISDLPEEILCFAMDVLQTLELSWMQNKKQGGKGGNDHGGGGGNFPLNSAFGTPSSVTYPRTENTFLPNVSWSDTEFQTSTQREELIRSVRDPWLQRLSELPLAMGQRRFGQITGEVPSTTKEHLTIPKSSSLS